MKFDSLAFIRDLTNANGAPGFEDEVIKVLNDYAEPHCGGTQEDKMRNYYAWRKNHNCDKPIVMLDGHTDEVAFMVQSINANGSLNFIALGGWHAQNVPAHKVRIRNRDGVYIPAIVASKPPHFMTDVERTVLQPITNMVIDCGASSYQEVVDIYKIDVAAPIIPDVSFSYNEDTGIMLGKAFDNRLGSACAIETIIELGDEELEVDVVAGIASQEEIGTRGAEITVRTIQPDLAIVFEGSPADDMYRDSYTAQCALKKGPQIRHRDRGMLSHPRFTAWARQIAKKYEIEFQDAVRLAGSTNGAKIHLGDLVVPTIVIGIPTRYVHTHYSFAAYEDYRNAIKWATVIIRELNQEVIESF